MSRCLECNTPLASDEIAFCGNDCERDYLIEIAALVLDNEGESYRKAQDMARIRARAYEEQA